MPSAIDLDDLSVRRGETLALDGVCACLPAAAVTAVVGGNGAGKSTLLDVLAGVLRPTSGCVDGLCGRTVAYVPQRSAVPDHLPLTIADTIAMGRWRERGPWRRLRAADRALVAAAAEQLGLTDLLAAPLSAVSGGQRQRALLAQGLVARADVLLVDEPTAGVDAATRLAVLQALATEAERGAVVVHATHEAAAVDRADAVLALSAGRVEVPAGAPGAAA
ncbi:zinc ABC transporter ATP-binding protein AztA [Blastococcus sp. TF02A-26]|uniref:zinc ABC transporter ATP-binding protein AztA n=1 Tax=Blastococcus sp. TF02A-26 TaxID=2250577 RepID=UPI000DE856F9|nr:zinc ABC transporter ATP-binding protein AztA [Blastococcus sp. TF02A-26]RBY86912.1 metal ABC transporter ATP-binding protein [Blastococcus sp. TF02A-26]